MRPAFEERLFPDGELLTRVLAEEIEAELKADLSSRGSATLVAAGGSTPGSVYDRLAQAPIAWERVQITVTDERWVSADDAASNARLIAERLRRGPAAAALYVSLLTQAPSPVAGEAEVERRVAELPRPFSVVLLGMGLDGHVASLFPSSPQLSAALDPERHACVCAVGPIDGAAGAAWRMSLTLRALTDTRRILLLLRGEEKLEVCRAALHGEACASPIAAVLQQRRAPVTLFWAP